MAEICSFPPIAGIEPTTLVLGSMPGEESLKKDQYYAHPRNSFWTIICTLLGVDVESLDYEGKCTLLRDNNIALWDVLKSCRRAGSLDSSIDNETVVVNDFNSFYEQFPTIDNVFFNGSRAEQEYRKRVLPYLNEELTNKKLIRLPSTSPAMAMMTAEEKTEHWSVIKRDKISCQYHNK